MILQCQCSPWGGTGVPCLSVQPHDPHSSVGPCLPVLPPGPIAVVALDCQFCPLDPIAVVALDRQFWPQNSAGPLLLVPGYPPRPYRKQKKVSSPQRCQLLTVTPKWSGIWGFSKLSAFTLLAVLLSNHHQNVMNTKNLQLVKYLASAYMLN